MFGQTGMGAGAVGGTGLAPQMSMIPKVPMSMPTAPISQAVAKAPAMKPNSLLQSIFGALFDPEGAAAAMASQGIEPTDFAASVKKPGALAEVMAKSAKPPVDIPGSDIITNNGLKIIQPGPEHPDIFPANADSFIGPKDILSLLGLGKGKQTDAATPLGATAGGLGTLMQPVQPMAQEGTTQGNLAPSKGALELPPPIVPNIAFGPGTASPGTAGAIKGGNITAPNIAPPVIPPNNFKMPVPPVEPVVSPKDGTGSLIAKNSGNLGGAVGSAPNFSGNEVFTGFMKTVRDGGVTNPNALAAIAATGKSESGWNPKNVFGAWSDPSESGAAGTSGGALSWRAERHAAMLEFVKKNGGNTAENQAKFFLQENPELVKKLNAAKTPEEAQTLMNEAWKFAGYNRPGGERDRRIALARNFASQFQTEGMFKDDAAGGGVGVGGTGQVGGPSGSAAPSETPTDEKALMDKLMAAFKIPEGSESADSGIPSPPNALLPRGGDYSPDPNIMKLIMMMLMPGGGGGGMQPTLAQIMAGRTGQAAA